MKRANTFADILLVNDALLAMQIYEWSAEKIIHTATLCELDFDEEEFLKKIREIDGTSTASGSTE